MYLNKTFNANMTVKDMALEERPREKMLAQGEKSLSNAELLAIILRTGTKQKNVIDLANYIINKDSQGIRYLQDITIDELCEIDGVGLTKATMIKAALELGRRVASFKPNKYKVKNPWDIYKYYMDSLRYLKKEVFKVVLLNTKNEIIKEQKKELRTKVKKKISKLSRRETEESDKKILHQIKSLAEYKNADTIFCYVSTEKEINTIPLLQEILDSGKRLGVPKCTGKGIMDAYEIQNLEQLKIGSYGILEPGEECDIILDPTEIQFAIIPCISCNRKGERLGHGGGYYDRYLEKMPEDCEKAILCRESLMCDEIPTEEHDERMDLVISENGIIRIKKEMCEI